MARIIFSLEEFLEILTSNELLPRQIVRARVKGERIHFVIRTNSFILPFIPASLRYVSFEGDTVTFELTIVSGRLDKAVSWLNQVLKVEMPAYAKLEYPNISVDIHKVLRESNIRGVRVEDIIFKNGEFTIVTEK